MKEKAEVTEKYKDFDAVLLSRPLIVLGMGWRQFMRFFNKNHQYTLLIGLLIYFILFFQIIFIMAGFTDYPCSEADGNGEKTCMTITFYQGFSKIFLILVAALASSGLISNDLTDNSIHLYLSRPISRTDYLIAKFIPIFLFLMMFTVMPNLLLYFTEFYNSGLEFEWLKEHKWLLFGIILQGILYSFSFSVIGLTFSAAIKRESFAAGGFFLLIYGLLIIVEFARYFIENDIILIFSISHQLELISYEIYNLDYFVWSPDEELRVALKLSGLWIYGIFFLVISSCLVFLQWTIYQMEATK